MIQIKNIILETTYCPDISVIRPHYIDPSLPPQRIAILRNEGTLVPFNSLSITGGILDTEAAVKKALEVTKQKSLKGF